MDMTLYFAFLIVSFWVIIIPGPNVLVIVSTSVTHGRKRGLQTVAGTSFAMAVQLTIVGVGTAWIVQLIVDGLYYLKWVGVAYLLYLGVRHLKEAINSSNLTVEITASATFMRGFLISLTNPKTILFFSAFLPQFVIASENYYVQILLLSLSFVILATLLDSCYALLSSKLVRITKNGNLARLQNGFSGLLFLGAGAWLVSINRSP